MKKALIATGLLCCSLSSHSLEQNFFSLKHTQFTPVFDNDGVFPEDSLDFSSSTFKEVMYQSPTDKAFSIQLSGLLNADNEFDEVKALLDWGGIVMVASSGSIEGRFNQTDEARLPGMQDPDELFQTLLPAEQAFEGESQFYGVGITKDDGTIMGLGYTKKVMPVLLSVDTDQSYTFGYNSATRDYENYHPEGTYPYKAVDAEGTIEHFGLWVRLDPLREAFETVEYSNRAEAGFFFGMEVMSGIAVYTPGDQVSVDYAYATEQVAASRGEAGEGTTLTVADSTSLLSTALTYSTGYQVVLPFENSIVGFSVGVDGSLAVHLFEPDAEYGSGAEAELFTESFGFSYGFFARVAASF
jgi:hypothetical protein